MSSFVYEGKVTFKVKINDKFIEIKNHNKGKDVLFELFTKLLVGEEISGEQKPYEIDIRSSMNNIDWISCLTAPVQPNKYSTKDTNGRPVAIISASISASMITNLTGNQFKVVLLNKLNEELAEALFDRSVLEKTIQGSQALIEWSLGVKNV